MKFLIPATLAFAAIVTAGKDCDALEKKIPSCATECVNAAAPPSCKDGGIECNCQPDTLEQIIKDSSDCVAKACKGQGPVFPPLREWCQCRVGKPTKTTTTAKPTATPTCAAKEDEIPTCAISCFNEEALKLCDKGEVECGCKPENVEKIVAGSKSCIAEKCKGKPPAVPPFRDFCKCVNGDHSTTTTKSSAKPTKSSTTESSSKPTDTTKTSSAASSKPTTSASSKPTASISSTSTGSSNSTTTSAKTQTTASHPVTVTTTVITTTVCPITSCAETVTGCTIGDMTTETLTLTTTWCPETETQVLPCPTDEVTDSPEPPYPTHTAGPGVPSVSHVPSGSAVQPQPPAVTGAAANTQRNAGAVVGAVVAFAGFAWL